MTTSEQNAPVIEAVGHGDHPGQQRGRRRDAPPGVVLARARGREPGQHADDDGGGDDVRQDEDGGLAVVEQQCGYAEKRRSQRRIARDGGGRFESNKR